MMQVKNMRSCTSGREVANQFIIVDNDNNVIMFQSYSSPIVSIDLTKQVITIYPDWDYSMTTGKYRNQFMSTYFPDMANKKGFEYYMNLGAIGNFDIIKAFN